MCICLNCLRIQKCNVYSIIAEKHQERLSVEFITSSRFFPQSPVIFTILSPSFKRDFLLEWDVNECLSYQEQPGNWIKKATKLSTKNSREYFSYLIYDSLFECNHKLNHS